ncbi:MAG: hypothetical protein ACI4VF_04885, partial [Lachnospirales bacterium]
MSKDYEQMQLDVTLSHERALKDNVTTMVEFVYKQNLSKGAETIKNKHEGYGIVAENHSRLAANIKSVKDDMATILKLLPGDSGEFIGASTSLYNSAVETAMAAINLAAESKRIIDDLYNSIDDLIPI